MTLTNEQRAQLERWVRRGWTPCKQATRAESILLTADGVRSSEIVRRTRVSHPTLTRWRQRFREEDVAGLLQRRTRKPGKAPVPQAKIEAVLTVTVTVTGRPADATHWSPRSMAPGGTVGDQVQEIWRAAELAPHRVRSFKVSNDRSSP